MAPHTNSTDPRQPPGSVYLDHMMRVLPLYGSSQFHLPQDENKRYTLETIYKTINEYKAAEFPERDFWERVLLGSPHTHICLLPSTETGREYHRLLKDDSVLLRAQSVKPLMFEVFKNLVQQDIRREKRFRRPIGSAPTRRRKQPIKPVENDSIDGRHQNTGQSLDAMTDSFAAQRAEDMEAQARVAFGITLKLLKNQLHAQVIESMLINDLDNKELATRFDMTASNVRAIRKKFEKLLYRTWCALENSRN